MASLTKRPSLGTALASVLLGFLALPASASAQGESISVVATVWGSWFTWFVRWLDPAPGGGGSAYNVPELDPSAAASVLVLLVGVALVMHARKSRA